MPHNAQLMLLARTSQLDKRKLFSAIPEYIKLSQMNQFFLRCMDNGMNSRIRPNEREVVLVA